MTTPIRFSVVITASAIILSSLLLALLNFLFGEDRAGVLASALHL